MAGKILQLIILSTFHLVNTRKADLRGGLLFEQERDQLIPINPKYSLYHRVISLDQLTTAANTASEFVQAYKEFCTRIDNEIKQDTEDIQHEKAQFYLVNKTQRIGNAPKVCVKQHHLMLPELRTRDDILALREFAKLHNVRRIYAGIYYDKIDAQLKYISNDKPIEQLFKKLIYDGNMEAIIPTQTANTYLTSFPQIVYEPIEWEQILVAGQENTLNSEQPIICQTTPAKYQYNLQNKYTLKLTSHVCNRDKVRLENMVNTLHKEIKLFQHFTENSQVDNEEVDNTLVNVYSNKRVRNTPDTTCTPTTDKSLIQIIERFQAQAFKYEKLWKIPKAISIKYLQFELLSQFDHNIKLDVFMQDQKWIKTLDINNPFYQAMLETTCILNKEPIDNTELLKSNVAILFDMDHTNFVNYVKTLLGIKTRQSRATLEDKQYVHDIKEAIMTETNTTIKNQHIKHLLLHTLVNTIDEHNLGPNATVKDYMIQWIKTHQSNDLKTHSGHRHKRFITPLAIYMLTQTENKENTTKPDNPCDPGLYKLFEIIIQKQINIANVFNASACDPGLYKLFQIVVNNQLGPNQTYTETMSTTTTTTTTEKPLPPYTWYDLFNGNFIEVMEDTFNLGTAIIQNIPRLISDTPLNKIENSPNRQKRLVVAGVALHHALRNQNAITNLSAVQLMHSNAINTLLENQITVKEAYTKMNDQIFLLRNITDMHEFAIEAMIAEKDTKDACESLNNIVQNSLLKLANAITEALSHRTSPFILSTRELHSIATQERKNKLLLSTNIEEIYSTLYRNESTYVFSFAIPVINDESTYRLYSIRNFPIFGSDNKTVIVKPDIKYIGVSADTTKYIELTDREYNDCTQGTFCQTSGSPNAFSNKASCAAQTLRSDEVHCEKMDTTEVHPFFATYETITYYSVPLHYPIDIICPNNKAKYNKATVRGIETLSGIGQISININCFLKLPDDRIILSHQMPEKSTDLGVSSITEALHNIIKPGDYLVPWTNNSFWADKPVPTDLILKESPFEITNFLEHTFDPKQFSQHTLRTTIIIIVTCVLFGIFCFFSRDCFRWAKTFFLISNPRKYWTNQKGLHVPYFTKLPKPEKQENRSFLNRHLAIGRLLNLRQTQTNQTNSTQSRERAIEEDVRVYLNTGTTQSSPTIVKRETYNRHQAQSPYSGQTNNYDYNTNTFTELNQNTYIPVAPQLDEPCSRQRDMDSHEWGMTIHQAQTRLKAANAHLNQENNL